VDFVGDNAPLAQLSRSPTTPRTPVDVRPAKQRTSPTSKRMLRPFRVVLTTGLNRDQPLPLLQLHRYLSAGANVLKVRKGIAPQISRGGDKQNMQILPIRFTFRQVHKGREPFMRGKGQYVNQRFSSGLRGTQRELIDLKLIGLAQRRKNNKGVWVLATKTWETLSSSRVVMPDLPRPPRF